VADFNVKGEMTLSTGSFISSAKAASDSLNGLNGASKNAGAGINILDGLMKKITVGALAAYTIKLGRDSVKAAQDAGAAQFRLSSLLKIASGATEQQVKYLNAQSDALAKQTVVSKENVQVVQSQLATFNLHTDAIAKLTPAILDYVTAEKGAAAGSDEYKQMTNGLALALNGQFGALTRVGFVMDKQTKAQISQGTEMERAAAIAKVLDSTYKDYAITVGDTAAGAQQKLANQANNLKQSFGEALLPVMQQVQMFMGNNLIPTISGFMDKLKNSGAISSFVGFMGNLIKSLVTFVSAVGQAVGPVLVNVLVPAFALVGAAIVGVIKVLGAIGSFMKQHIEVFQTIAEVVVGAALAYGAYRLAVMAGLAMQKLHTAYTIASTAATTAFTTAQRMLNATMAFNPVALVVGALVALAAGFVIAWNHSETFRKVVIAIGKAGVIAFGYLIEWIGKIATAAMTVATGPLQLLLKGLALLQVPGAKEALNGIQGAIKGVGTFFAETAAKVKGYADNLDSLANKKIKLPSFSLGGGAKTGATDNGSVGASAAGTINNDAASKLAAQVADLKTKLKDVVQGYNDFIVNDFAAGFVKSDTDARDTMLKGLDELRKVFDAQQAIYEAQSNTKAVENVKAQWDKINEYVRSRIAEAMAIAKELTNVSDQLDKAQTRLADAIAARKEGAKAFTDMMRTPFGEPSDIQKGLASGQATVDSIITMYDKMRDALDKRFTDIGGSKKDELINLLTDQTAKLIALAKRRDAASKALEEAQKHLDDVLSKQAAFKTNISDSIKSFGLALADLSKTNGDTTIKVIKTASGLVVTQMGQSKNGVDTIIDKLKSSLATIKEFTTNIQTLLAMGYNKEYVRTLLEAGPEAAGATAALLAKSGQDTVATVNDLYSQVNTASEVFGTTMSDTFYANSVAMAKAMVDGAQSEYNSIVAEMKSIADGITTAFSSLRDLGTNVGNDIAQGLVDALTKRKQELIDLANSIAAAIAAAMAAAASSIGVSGVSSSITPNPSGGGSSVVPPVVVAPETAPQTAPIEEAAKAVAEVAKAATQAFTKVTIKKGDTLSAIAKANNESLSQLLKDNPVFTSNPKYQNGNMIWAGGTVKIASAPETSFAGSGSGVNTNSLAGINSASNSTTNIAAGAFQITVPPSTAPSDLEPVMTRALLNALSAR
jgi:LysM repeat protein/phage-related protein